MLREWMASFEEDEGYEEGMEEEDFDYDPEDEDFDSGFEPDPGFLPTAYWKISEP